MEASGNRQCPFNTSHIMHVPYVILIRRAFIVARGQLFKSSTGNLFYVCSDWSCQSVWAQQTSFCVCLKKAIKIATLGPMWGL